MGMTITQKILAEKSGQSQVRPGQLIMAETDLVLGNDITAPVAIDEFYKIGCDTVFDKTKIALVADHFTPNKAVSYTHLMMKIREGLAFLLSSDHTRYCFGKKSISVIKEYTIENEVRDHIQAIDTFMGR